MGSSESKMSASAAMKPEPAMKKTCVSHLVDPRSPSAIISRTPIQIAGPESKSSTEVKSNCPLVFVDPRSPTVGITRTPVRDVMRATVGSFARRLGQLFHNEAEGKAPEGPKICFNDTVADDLRAEEMASTTPLLAPQLTKNSLAEHANLLATPKLLPLQTTADSSPFVLLEETQVEADFTLEEAEEARESPLHKRLSMSLITCNEGAPSSQIYAEVHSESDQVSEPSGGVQPVGADVEHSYALASISAAPESSEQPLVPDLVPSPVKETPAHPEEAEKLPSSEETKELNGEPSLPAVPSDPPTVPSPKQSQVCNGIRCPTFDPKSPSQVEFKPQWLGKGFGASGLRARGKQGGGKGGSSPLAFRVAVKNLTNENKGQSGKIKQKDTAGRSPLQTLRETNSPRDQRSQMKLKASTPDKQRPGQLDRRVLVCLDKENR
ncbi:cell division cycle-associated protein 3 [Cololabis saira]|uniref:cell division cycle-associated protein 3 n=1 Tax=Cololabis saira TaxID=129043 RepID=UPI002AD486D4|nr:cell division cycle-associated protein 3 [Cololabis saira]